MQKLSLLYIVKLLLDLIHNVVSLIRETSQGFPESYARSV